MPQPWPARSPRSSRVIAWGHRSATTRHDVLQMATLAQAQQANIRVRARDCEPASMLADATKDPSEHAALVHAMLELSQKIEGELIDGLIDNGNFQPALASMARSFRAVNAGIVVLRPGIASGALYQVLEPERAVLAAYLPDIMDDPWVRALNRRRGPVATSGARLVRPSVYRKTRHYADFVRPVGHEHIAVVGHFTGGPSVSLTTYRSRNDVDFDDAALQRMATLLPVIARFHRLWDTMKRSASSVTARDTFEVDRQGLRNVGERVPAQLEAVKGVTLAAGELRMHGIAGDTLRLAIARCLDGEQDSPHAVPLGGTLLAIVRPRLELDVRMCRQWLAVVELVHAFPAGAPTTLPVAAEALTPAEHRVACALLKGETLRGYAQRTGRSLHTVRRQLKDAMAKLGARRQVDLARLLRMED